MVFGWVNCPKAKGGWDKPATRWAAAVEVVARSLCLSRRAEGPVRPPGKFTNRGVEPLLHDCIEFIREFLSSTLLGQSFFNRSKLRLRENLSRKCKDWPEGDEG